MPDNAPNVSRVPRSEYHRFMLGKPTRFHRDFRVFFFGLSITALILGEMSFALFQLRPDDFDFVKEERDRAQNAKERIDARIRAQGGGRDAELVAAVAASPFGTPAPAEEVQAKLDRAGAVAEPGQANANKPKKLTKEERYEIYEDATRWNSRLVDSREGLVKSENK